MRFLASFLLCLSLSLSCFAGKRYVAGQDKAYNVVKESDLERNLGFLTGTICAGRQSGEAGSVIAANFVKDVFAKHNLPCIVQPFALDKGKYGHNIVGFFQGNKKRPCGRYVVVMAYYDGLGTLNGKLYPGADANASGLVAMTSLAELFAVHKLITGDVFGESVIFVALDGHNRNLSGSRAFYKTLQEKTLVDSFTKRPVGLDQIDLVVNIEQIGSTLSPLTPGREAYLVMLGTRTLTQDEMTMVRTVNWFYDMNLDLGFSYYGSDSFTKLFERLSDQKPFVDAGKRFLFVTSGITYNTNKTTDTVDKLNIFVFRKRILYLFRVIEKLIG